MYALQNRVLHKQGRTCLSTTTAMALLGHKADCKLLKDAYLKGILFLNWDKFDRHAEFSLNNVTD